ncbi:MAG: GxxExxY protein [Candidatus Moranbacteria bacterium]|nr:GxxExxY protein [Candidatus Moranbacteria bacterium]
MKRIVCSDKVIHKELSYKIVGVLFCAYNELGYGFQEKYYQKAIEQRLSEEKIKYKSQVPFKISFRGKEIGRYYLDLLIEDKVVVEIKKGNYFSKKNIEQVKGYLKATGLKLAIIANFTSKGVNFLRIVNI